MDAQLIYAIIPVDSRIETKSISLLILPGARNIHWLTSFCFCMPFFRLFGIFLSNILILCGYSLLIPFFAGKLRVIATQNGTVY